MGSSCRILAPLKLSPLRQRPRLNYYRFFHASQRHNVLKPFLLADIGEGTRECQIIQWFVQPGARVEQFDKICEVQSDKATSDITSPFDGVIKKLYYEADDVAIVGKPLLDIDIQSEISPEDEAMLDTSGGEQQAIPKQDATQASTTHNKESRQESREVEKEEVQGPLGRANRHENSLATPAVRHLTKELGVSLEDVQGTGRDGRVLKEDVHRHASQSKQQPATHQRQQPATQQRQQPATQQRQQPAVGDQKVPLTPVQTAMFKAMTRSLSIPHFLYSSTVDMVNLSKLRERLNRKREAGDRLTPLPFILKAVSLAFTHHPLLNARLDTSNPDKPELSYHSEHNFGVAVDTPSGLLVPVIRNIESQSVASIAAQVRSMSAKAREGKLGPGDFKGASFTVSNIGSIGGGVVAPIIVSPQVGIVGVGRSRVVAGFDEQDNLVKKEEAVLSWSADHRVVDGAECARCAERVRGYLESIEEWVVEMR